MSNLKDRLKAKAAEGQTAPPSDSVTTPSGITVTTVAAVAPENEGGAGEPAPTEGTQPFTAGTAPGYEGSQGPREYTVGSIRVSSR